MFSISVEKMKIDIWLLEARTLNHLDKIFWIYICIFLPLQNFSTLIFPSKLITKRCRKQKFFKKNFFFCEMTDGCED